MERDVFSRPDIAATIARQFVPVKVNVAHFPAKTQEYGITTVPTDVITTPDGRMVGKVIGGFDPPEYIAQLNRQLQGRVPQPQGQFIASGPVGMGQPVPGVYTPPTPPVYHNSGLQNPGNEIPEPQTNPYVNPSPNTSSISNAPNHQYQAPESEPESPLAAQLPPNSPPLILDGFCPVQLAENECWVQGDARWGARHEGRTYLFVGPEEQKRFLAEPQKYAPVFSGNDVVFAVEQGRTISGRREHGAWYHGKVYLFSSEDSFQRFNNNAEQYLSSLNQITSGLARQPSPPPPVDPRYQGTPPPGVYY